MRGHAAVIDASQPLATRPYDLFSKDTLYPKLSLKIPLFQVEVTKVSYFAGFQNHFSQIYHGSGSGGYRASLEASALVTHHLCTTVTFHTLGACALRDFRGTKAFQSGK